MTADNVVAFGGQKPLARLNPTSTEARMMELHALVEAHLITIKQDMTRMRAALDELKALSERKSIEEAHADAEALLARYRY